MSTDRRIALHLAAFSTGWTLGFLFVHWLATLGSA
jgi:hypothetical protein